MLEIVDYTKHYKDKLAVDSLSVNVSAQEIYGLLGPNGAGKTTTLFSIVGINTPSSGRISINKLNLIDAPKEYKKQFGFVPDESFLPESLTGEETLDFLQSIYEVKDQERKNKLLKIFRLEEDKKRMIKTYSHGMKKKISVIGALLHSPKLFIVDEPFRGLDPEAVFVLRSLMLSQRNSGGSVLIATHDMTVAEALCDRVCIISEGKKVAEGAPHELLELHEAQNLEEVFLKATGLEREDKEIESIFSHSETCN